MEFSGTFELEDTTVDEVWLALSDPVLIADSLPGCEYLLEVDGDVDFDELDERAAECDRELSGDPEVIARRAFQEGQQYAVLLQVSVGPVNPTFQTVGTVVERDRPRMRVAGEGSSGDSSFEVSSGMELVETDAGVEVQWEAEADVFGRVANVGQRVVNPVANRQVKRFFSSIQTSLHELTLAEMESADASADEDADTGLVDRVLGRSGSDSSDSK